MKKYFELQFRMTKRRFKDSGFHPILGYLMLTLVFIGLSNYLFLKSEFAEYLYIFSALTLISKLSENRRTEFLKICFGNPKMKQLRLTENLMGSTPFITFLLYRQLYNSVFLLLVLAILLAIVNFKTKMNFTLWTPFSKRPFEFTTGFRNTYYLYCMAYILVAIAIAVNNFNLGLFTLLLVYAVSLSYHINPENEYYIWSYNTNVKKFLFGKIKTALLYSTSLALPIVICLTIFYPQHIGNILLSLLVGWSFLISAIVSKYSTYPDELNITQSIFLAFCIWFPPILIVLIPYLFKKSETRLSYLLK